MFRRIQKITVLLILTCGIFFNITPAKATLPLEADFVVDNAGVLSDQAERILSDLSQQTNHTFAVATVADLNGQPVEEYSIDLARRWQIGEAEKDNGVLLFLAPNEHVVRIEVGYGMEGVLTDAMSATILAQMEPYLKQNDFDNALLLGAAQIVNVIKNNPIINTTPFQENDLLTTVKWMAIVFVVLLFIWVGMAPREDRARRIRFILFLLSVIPGRGGFKGHGGGGSFGGGGASKKF